ncbi:hypothetical protein [Poseidonocella sp. HB161398]|uniref:hypothetical protein n=1 Tax=Poseidonocella sp. HB161398 TaxID=2320855 RepID=UPI001107D058|nr:hypothetical protein [Poseidonocella sp. HB161398]
MTFLVYVTVMVLILGLAGMLAAAIGAMAWLLGALAALAFTGWLATLVGLSPYVVLVALFFFAPAWFLAAVAISRTIENRKRPREEHKSFGEFMRTALDDVSR